MEWVVYDGGWSYELSAMMALAAWIPLLAVFVVQGLMYGALESQIRILRKSADAAERIRDAHG